MNGNIWIWAYLPDYGDGKKWNYIITSHDGMEERGWVLIEKRPFEFEVPDEKALTIKTVEAMRTHLAKMRAEHQSEETLLEERINNMLAIEHKPEVA